MPENSADCKTIALAITATSLFWVSLFSVCILVWTSPSGQARPSFEGDQPVLPHARAHAAAATSVDQPVLPHAAAATSLDQPVLPHAAAATSASAGVFDEDELLAKMIADRNDNAAGMNKYCMSMRPRKGCHEWPRLPKAGEQPCLSDVLADLIISSTQVLSKHDVVHWVAYGTLLGIYRDHAVIPWTTDADMAVYVGDKQTLINKLKLDFYKAGFWIYNLKPNVVHSPLRVCVSAESTRWKHAAVASNPTSITEHWPRIDFFPASNVSDSEIEIVHGCIYKSSTIFPLSTVKLFGNSIPAPHNVPLHLKNTYGPRYMFPPENKQGGLGHCRPEYLRFES
eukprot:TRINITY_DN567_c0_g1_i1.p1 TRINITY_DN567_c0_g1~~TRINITY_DN567_c0_g1_i1.p1  ORF type:complete len:340 (+),score=7.27 TRINITY_DN567_c0_g1_i1:157-1176(+)